MLEKKQRATSRKKIKNCFLKITIDTGIFEQLAITLKKAPDCGHLNNNILLYLLQSVNQEQACKANTV